MLNKLFYLLISSAACLVLCQCGAAVGGGSNMGGPTVEERNAQIATEATGNFFYGRRYFVEKTRFWGYVRKPRQSWNRAKLVMMREDRVRQPDRLSESGPAGQRYSFDQNYEYRISGNFTGRKVYDPNSNQILDEFMPTRFELVNRQPGWIFRPDDRYNSSQLTLVPR